MNLKINWDALGVGTSLACAIHCAVLPLVITSLPVFGINIIDNSDFEYFMILLAFAIGLYALAHGFRKHHRHYFPIILFALGILLLFAKQRWHAYQFWFLPFAVLFIVLAHFINFRLCRAYNHIAKEQKQPAG
jgi:hypothetical protein